LNDATTKLSFSSVSVVTGAQFGNPQVRVRTTLEDKQAKQINGMVDKLVHDTMHISSTNADALGIAPEQESLLRERAAAWMRIRRESDSKAPCRRIDYKDTVVLVVSSKTSIAHVAKRGLVGSIDATALVDAEGNWKIAGTVIIEAYVSLAPDVTDPQAFSVKACIVDPMVAKSKPKLDQWEREQLAGLDSDDDDDNTMHSSQ